MAVNSLVDKFFKKILGTNSEKFLKQVIPVVQQINDFEEDLKETFG